MNDGEVDAHINRFEQVRDAKIPDDVKKEILKLDVLIVLLLIKCNKVILGYLLHQRE